MSVNTGNPFFKAKPQDFLTVVFGVALIGIILILVSLTLTNSSQTKQQPNNNTPSISLPLIKTNDSTIKYNAKKQDDLYKKLQNPAALSQSDNTIKTKLIDSLGNETGMLYASNNVAISYLKSVDLFQAEILTPDIQTAKQEANTWLTTQGFSHQGICNLPVIFFLNAGVANQLQNSKIIFSPLPNGC